MRQPRWGGPPITVITAAEPSQAQQLRSRQKRYLIMMGLRVLCLIAAAVSYGLGAMWAVPVLVVGMVALPWMAVLIANDRPPLKPSKFRRTTIPPNTSHAIESPAGNVIDQ